MKICILLQSPSVLCHDLKNYSNFMNFIEVVFKLINYSSSFTVDTFVNINELLSSELKTEACSTMYLYINAQKHTDIPLKYNYLSCISVRHIHIL